MIKQEVFIDGVKTMVSQEELTPLGNGLFHKHYNSDMTVNTVAEEKEIQQQMINHFTFLVDATIEDKITEYNTANGVVFANADAFTKYAINTASQHHTIANQFIVWIDKLWAKAREIQATAVTMPTDAEFKAALDAVVF